MDSRAAQACEACRRLKRKCPKELPSCSLCVRLDKQCMYPPSSRRRDGQSEGFQPHLSPFPEFFLLDSSSFAQFRPEELDPGMVLPPWVLEHLPEELLVACKEYESFHTSFPIINLVTLQAHVTRFDTQRHSGLALLLLSMGLMCSQPDEDQHPATLPLYQAAKRLYSLIESNGMVSLRLLQSGILIAMYEVGQRIFPAAYLSIANIVRLAMMMGFHDRRNSAQLSKPSLSTPVFREEERRAWWACFILDRYIHVGTIGLPLSAPDPGNGDLLLCCDSLWAEGKSGSNQSILATSLAHGHAITPYASCCQASHMLGRVLRHRDDHTNRLDPTSRLEEAFQLHKALVALDTDLYSRYIALAHIELDDVNKGAAFVAYALCCTARFLLYNMYGCNEPDATSIIHGRIAVETEMQQTSVQGIKFLAMTRVAELVRSLPLTVDGRLDCSTPLLIYVIYHAASECAWFIKEGRNEMIESMGLYVNALRMIDRKWRVAGSFLRILEHEGALATLEEALATDIVLS